LLLHKSIRPEIGIAKEEREALSDVRNDIISCHGVDINQSTDSRVKELTTQQIGENLVTLSFNRPQSDYRTTGMYFLLFLESILVENPLL
jgi:hypothetical protein